MSRATILAPGTSFTTALAEGVARHLAAAGVGAWSPASAYAAGQTGIIVGDLPANPERVIALATYGVDDDPSLSDSVIGLQAKTRWGGQDPRPVGALSDAVFDQLHGLTDLTLPTGVHLVESRRTSWGPLGQDANARWRETSNFYLTVHRPSRHRT